MYKNPYDRLRTPGVWLKANFHTHAGTGMGTCGQNEIQVVTNAYADAGYDVLCISNHDLFTDCGGFTNDKIMFINGFEYSATPHMLLVGGKICYLDEHQVSLSKALAEGAFAVLCHPNWTRPWYWPKEKLLELTGYTGIEVINQLIYRLTGSGLASDVWDWLLSRGRLVYGFGSDDFHRWMDLGRSFTCVYSASREEADIKAAVNAGCLYASTGLFISNFEFDGAKISLAVRYKDADLSRDYRYRFIGKDGVLLWETVGRGAEYTLRGDELYVRAEVTGENGYMLFTQPVYLEESFTKP